MDLLNKIEFLINFKELKNSNDENLKKQIKLLENELLKIELENQQKLEKLTKINEEINKLDFINKSIESFRNIN